MPALLSSLARQLSQLTCSHHWVRARWADGSYGLRCGRCMKPYPVTWNALLEAPQPKSASVETLPVAGAGDRRPGPVVVERPANRPQVA